MTNRSLLH